EYTFPAGDGQNGQVLVTDSAGTLSWSSASGGSNWVYDTQYNENVIRPSSTLAVWANDDLYVSSTLVVDSGSAATSTFFYGANLATAGGNVGIGTTIPSHLLTLTSNDNTPLLAIGNGSGTTTLVGGEAGLATSTFAGDVEIDNLYIGEIEFGVDSGIIDFVNIPVSASASDGTSEGYNFLIDGLPAMSIVGIANGSGETKNNYVGIGTMYPSDYLTVVSSTASIAIGDGSTTSTVSKNTIALGADSTNETTGIFYVDSSGNVSASGTIYGSIATSTFYGSIATSTFYGSWSTSTIDNIIIGGTTAAAGTFTYVSTTALSSYDGIFVGRTTTSTIYGSTTSSFGAGVSATALNITSTSVTSTFANGITLNGGCFEDIAGNCLAGADGIGANAALSNLSSVAINESLISDANYTDDLGSFAKSWKDIYASGTIYAAILTISSSTATSTFEYGVNMATDGGNVGIGTEIPSHLLTLTSNHNTALLAIGNGSATTTLVGGEAGLATSTFAGDVEIDNLYSGLITFGTDAGVTDAMDIPVSGSASDGTLEGYSFLIDGVPAMSIVGVSNGSGKTRDNFVGIGTMYPSDYLTVVSSTASIAIGDGSTTSTVSKNTIALGADSTNETTGIFYVDSSGNVSASGTIYGSWSTSTIDNIIIGGTTAAAGTFTYVSTTALSSYDGIFVGRTSTSTIYGSTTSSFGAGVSATALNITSTSVTSTFANGITLSGGCFEDISGACITAAGAAANAALSNLASVAINESLISDANYTDDLGSFAKSWKDIYASGTIYAAVLTISSSTATSTFEYGINMATDGGNVGIGTEIPSHLLTLTSNNNTPLLAIGNGSGTTTLVGGEAGLATSTFAGDVEIDNLYSGLITFPTDGGIVAGMNLPVSGSASDGDLEGYSFLIDNIPAMSIVGVANGSGETKNNFVGIGTMYPSDYLTVVSSTASIAIGDGSTTSTISKNTIKLGEASGYDSGIFYVDSSGNVSASGTLAITNTGTSTFSGGVEATALDITSTSVTSTFANGIQLTSGCILLPDGDCAGTGAGGGADTDLGNLASVAINTSLLPASTGSIDLGSYAKTWKDIYASGTLYIGDAGTTATSSIYTGVETGVLNITSTSVTSTFANGITLSGGCFQDVNGDCMASSAGGGADTALSNLSSVAINESLISDTENTDDLGSFAKSWKDIYASGTLYTDGLNVSSVGIGTTAASHLLTLTSNNNTPLLAIGNGSGTTTLVGGEAGLATSTFAGDVEIDNLYMGKIEMALDNGISEFVDAPVSGAPTDGDEQGYAFLVDGLSVMRVVADADSSGSVDGLRLELTNGLGTATTTIYGGHGTTSSFAGNLAATGTITSNCSGTCLDIAEQYSSLDSVESGDVVVSLTDDFIPSGAEESPYDSSLVQKAGTGYAANVVGVVSTNPGLILSGSTVTMGSNGSKDSQTRTPYIALAGRVPVKVTNENGIIKKGDILVTSISEPGHAMKFGSDAPDGIISVFAMALEDWNPETAVSSTNNSDITTNKIEAIIKSGFVYKESGSGLSSTTETTPDFGETLSVTSTDEFAGTITNIENDLDMAGHSILNVASIQGIDGIWSIDENGNFSTKGEIIKTVTTSQGDKDVYPVYNEDPTIMLTGSGEIINGEARILFDPILSEVMDPNEPIETAVTLTSQGVQGIYVAEKSIADILVREINGGLGTATFDYIIIAKRKLAGEIGGDTSTGSDFTNSLLGDNSTSTDSGSDTTSDSTSSTSTIDSVIADNTMSSSTIETSTSTTESIIVTTEDQTSTSTPETVIADPVDSSTSSTIESGTDVVSTEPETSTSTVEDTTVATSENTTT
ncbi:beta strand repeat-containing protein, partial [Patescibacteria group bacterium]